MFQLKKIKTVLKYLLGLLSHEIFQKIILIEIYF
jgi:hypothetical protein